jgi:hypothetical protein
MGGSDETKFDHPTQKPVELMRRLILNHTKRGELVYEPFLGSGTTLAAAQLTERICFGLELDPKYVDVIVQRWQDLPGKKATLEADGRSFESYLERQDRLGDWTVLNDLAVLPSSIRVSRPIFIMSRVLKPQYVVFWTDPAGWNAPVYNAASSRIPSGRFVVKDRSNSKSEQYLVSQGRVIKRINQDR